MISERIFEQEGEDAYLCGILHDIGMIVEDQVAQDLFFRVCKTYEPESKLITDYEREIIGTDHCRVGYLLARDWKLPIEVQEGIKQHHKTLENISPSSIAGIIQIAEYIVSKLNYTAIPGMNAVLSSPLANHIRDNVEEYRVLIKELPDEMSKAKDLYESHED
jgi:putative nucleotidyltransferase with HDIG domain